MAVNPIVMAFAKGVAAPRSNMLQKMMFGRLASVPDDAGDGFTYNQPWRLVSASGKPVSEATVLRLSAAMACVRLLSQTISTLPLGIFERQSDGGRAAANSHWSYEVLHNQPNADMTAVDFWQVMIAWMMLRGNAYAEKLRIGNRIVGLQPLYAPAVSCIRLANGDYDFYYTENGKRRKIVKEDMWHIPAFTLDGLTGLSPIKYGAGVFQSAMSADEASRNVFDSGLSASGFVTTKDWLSPEQRNDVRGHIDEFTFESTKKRGVFVLENGMEYKPLSMNPEDAQMLETRMFNIEEVCRWFGLDPSLIGHGQKVSNFGTGLEEKNLGFLAYCLTPWLKKIEQSIRKNLFTPAEKVRYFAEFNVAGLLRGNAAARADYYSRMVNNGLMTRDEVRRLENYQLMGGNAEVLTVQTALTPINLLGAAVQGQGGKSVADIGSALQAAFPLLTDVEIDGVLRALSESKSLDMKHA